MEKLTYYDVPEGWSPFSTKGTKRVPLRLCREHIPAPTQEVFNPEKSTVKERLLLPIMYQGVGDLLRTSKAIKNLSKKFTAPIDLVLLDTPLARDFVTTQFETFIHSVYWLKAEEPYIAKGQSISTLDWEVSESHVIWQIALEKLLEQETSNFSVLRSPNNRMPPYKQLYFDYTLRIFISSDRILEYELSSSSIKFAADFWNQYEIEDGTVLITLVMRTDKNLLSSHKRNLRGEVINLIVAQLKETFEKLTILMVGDAPPEDMMYQENVEYIDLTQCWRKGILINQQAAVVAHTQAVIGANSGALDVYASSGLPLLRLNGNLDNVFHNDLVNAQFSINVPREHSGSFTRATRLGTDLLLQAIMERADHKNVYIGPNEKVITRKPLAVEIEIDKIITKDYAYSPEIVNVVTLEEAVEATRKGLLARINKNTTTEALRFLARAKNIPPVNTSNQNPIDNWKAILSGYNMHINSYEYYYEA